MRHWVLVIVMMTCLCTACTGPPAATKAVRQPVHAKRNEIKFTTLSQLGFKVKVVHPTGPYLCTSHVLAGKPVTLFYTC